MLNLSSNGPTQRQPLGDTLSQTETPERSSTIRRGDGDQTESLPNGVEEPTSPTTGASGVRLRAQSRVVNLVGAAGLRPAALAPTDAPQPTIVVDVASPVEVDGGDGTQEEAEGEPSPVEGAGEASNHALGATQSDLPNAPWRMTVRTMFFPYTAAGSKTRGMFEYFLVICLLLVLGIAAAFDYSDRQCTGPRCQALTALEVVLTAVFVLELALHWVSFGASKFAHPVRLLDASCVVGNVALLIAFASGAILVRPCLLIFRTPRVFRPLFTNTNFPSLRMFIVAMTQSVFQLTDVAILFLLLLLWFGAAGISQLGGSLQKSCVHVSYFDASLTKEVLLPSNFSNYSWGPPNLFRDCTADIQAVANGSSLNESSCSGRDIYLWLNSASYSIAYTNDTSVFDFSVTLLQPARNYPGDEDATNTTTIQANLTAAGREAEVKRIITYVSHLPASAQMEYAKLWCNRTVRFSRTTVDAYKCGVYPLWASTMSMNFGPDSLVNISGVSGGNQTVVDVTWLTVREELCEAWYEQLSPNSTAAGPPFQLPTLSLSIGDASGMFTDNSCNPFRTCDSSPTGVLKGYRCPYDYVCIDGGVNFLYGIVGYDSILPALLTNFITISFELWYDVMYLSNDSTDFFVVFYFVLLVVVGGILITSLTTVIVTVEFERTKEEERRRLIEQQVQKGAVLDTFASVVMRLKHEMKRTNALVANALTSPLRGKGDNDDGDAVEEGAVDEGANSMDEGGLMTTIRQRGRSAKRSFSPALQNLADGKNRVTGMIGASAAHMKSFAQPLMDNTTSAVNAVRYGFIAKYIVRTSWFEILSFVVIALNLVVLCLIHQDMSESEQLAQDTLNMIFAVAYSLELTLRAIASDSLRGFLKKYTTWIDVCVVGGAWVDILVSTSSGASIPVISSFRSIRIMKVITLFPSLYVYIKLILSALKAAPMVSLVLFLIVFVFACLSMQILGGSFCEVDFNYVRTFDFGGPMLLRQQPQSADSANVAVWNATAVGANLSLPAAAVACPNLPRANFDGFGYALLTSFVIATGDGWEFPMYNAIRVKGDWMILVFCVYYYIVGFVMFPLIVGVLLSAKENEFVDEVADTEVRTELSLSAMTERVMRTGKDEGATSNATVTGGAANDSAHTFPAAAGAIEPTAGHVRRRHRGVSARVMAQDRVRAEMERRARRRVLARGASRIEGMSLFISDSSSSSSPSFEDDSASSDSVELLLPPPPTAVPPEETTPPRSRWGPRNLFSGFRRVSVETMSEAEDGGEQIMPMRQAGSSSPVSLATPFLSAQPPLAADGSRISSRRGSMSSRTSSSHTPRPSRRGSVSQPSPGRSHKSRSAAQPSFKVWRRRVKRSCTRRIAAAHAALNKATTVSNPRFVAFCSQCKRLTTTTAFGLATTGLFAFGCGTLAARNPILAPDDPRTEIVFICEAVFTSLHLVEVALRCLAHGVILGEGALLRQSGWGVLCFLSALLSFVTLVVEGGTTLPGNHAFLIVLRVLRSIRPLRLVQYIPGCATVVYSLGASVTHMGRVMAICGLVLVICSIEGVRAFRGLMRSCLVADYGFVDGVSMEECSSLYRGVWTSSSSNFDNIGAAIVSIFTISTLEGWSDIMNSLMDASSSYGEPMSRNNTAWYGSIYSVLVVLLMALLVMNLFASVLIDAYNTVTREASHQKTVVLERQEGAILLSQARIFRCFSPQLQRQFIRDNPNVLGSVDFRLLSGLVPVSAVKSMQQFGKRIRQTMEDLPDAVTSIVISTKSPTMPSSILKRTSRLPTSPPVSPQATLLNGPIPEFRLTVDPPPNTEADSPDDDDEEMASINSTGETKLPPTPPTYIRSRTPSQSPKMEGGANSSVSSIRHLLGGSHTTIPPLPVSSQDATRKRRHKANNPSVRRCPSADRDIDLPVPSSRPSSPLRTNTYTVQGAGDDGSRRLLFTLDPKLCRDSKLMALMRGDIDDGSDDERTAPLVLKKSLPTLFDVEPELVTHLSTEVRKEVARNPTQRPKGTKRLSQWQPIPAPQIVSNDEESDDSQASENSVDAATAFSYAVSAFDSTTAAGGPPLKRVHFEDDRDPEDGLDFGSTIKNMSFSNITSKIADIASASNAGIKNLLTVQDETMDDYRTRARRVVRSQYVVHAANVLVLASFISMCWQTYPLSQIEDDSTFYLNVAFTSIFALEALIKIFVETIPGYFSSKWNRLDFLVAVTSALGTVLIKFYGSNSFALAQAFRLVRLVRLGDGRLEIRGLIGKMGKAMYGLLNITIVYAVTLFTFALVGLELFGRVKEGPYGITTGIDAHSGFNRVDKGLIILLRAMTGGNWPSIMQGLQYFEGGGTAFCEPQLGNCGLPSPVPEIYFILFVTASYFVLRNLMMAILVDSFSGSAQNTAEKKSSAAAMVQVWLELDPDGALKLRPTEILTFLRRIPRSSVLGFNHLPTLKRISLELTCLTRLKLRDLHTPVAFGHLIDVLCTVAYPDVDELPPSRIFAFDHAKEEDSDDDRPNVDPATLEDVTGDTEFEMFAKRAAGVLLGYSLLAIRRRRAARLAKEKRGERDARSGTVSRSVSGIRRTVSNSRGSSLPSVTSTPPAVSLSAPPPLPLDR